MKETYKYNNLGQLTTVSYDGTVTYKYTYTTTGDIETVTDVPNDCVYTYTTLQLFHKKYHTGLF